MKIFPGKKCLPSILYVEDDDDIHSLVMVFLNDHCIIKLAKTLPESRSMISEEAFELVLLDLNLTDGSGFDLLETIGEYQMPPRDMQQR
ncbi:MAG: response regulator [Spirochaetia bacterium]|nr:response regulator [Spirochaetia bacterium]